MTRRLARPRASSLKSLASTTVAEPPRCHLTPAALEAEKLAREFGLTYLSAEGYEKLARLLDAVRREACQVDEDAPILEHGRAIK